nr:outer membrane protein assembly factor BamD [Reinekea thalattae]
MPSKLFASHSSIFFITLALFLTSCASLNNQQNTEQSYYQAAQAYLDKSNYSLAIEQINQLQQNFPFGDYAKAASLDLIYAYYQTGDFDSALVEADRFIRLNPERTEVEYADFVRSMCFFELYMENRGLFKLSDPSIRSGAEATNAFSALSSFLRAYPSSDYRTDLLSAMVVLKDSIARHELMIAEFYIRKGAWIAAAERARTVIDHYPGVSTTADALVILIEAYDQLEQPEDKAIALTQLTTHYPTHRSLSSGDYVAPKWQEDRWWVKLLTLGIAS